MRRQPIRRPNPLRRFKNRFFPPRQYRPQYSGQVLYSPRFEQTPANRPRRLGPITRMRHYFDRDVVEFEKKAPKKKTKRQFMGNLRGIGGEGD